MICSLSSEENRSKCEIVGGTPSQEVEECLGNDTFVCDVFFQENCVYEGTDLGLYPPSDEVQNPGDCQEFCRIFQARIILQSDL